LKFKFLKYLDNLTLTHNETNKINIDDIGIQKIDDIGIENIDDIGIEGLYI
jgi:hypothetical protein